MNERYVLAIDLGTSGPKVALVSPYGDIFDSEFAPTKLVLLPNGGAEQDPDDWWSAIKTATQRLIGRNDNLRSRIIAVSCTAQWSGTIAVDEEGNHLTNAIIWMDSRGAPHVKKLTGGFPKISGYGVRKLCKWLKLTGGIPGKSGKDSIAHIWYLMYERPEIYRQAYKFLEPVNYLGLRFTGRIASSCDSMALHWLTDNRDLGSVNYNEDLLNLSRIPREKLPDLLPPSSVLGPIRHEVADELGLPRFTKVMVGTPDIQSATIGSGAIRDFDGYIYIGTSSWLTCHVPWKKLDIASNMTTLPSAIPGRYFIANTQESAGACLDFAGQALLRADLGPNLDNPGETIEPEDVYMALEDLVPRSPAGSNGAIFAPWLNGERTPVEDSSLRGGFFNLSPKHTRTDLVRAVYEGVALNTRWLLGCVERFTGRRFLSLGFSGGGAMSEIWAQILANVLGRPICRIKDPRMANARGAGIIGHVALKSVGSFEEAEKHRRHEKDGICTPDPRNREVYDKLFREFMEIHRFANKLYQKINRKKAKF